MVVEFPNAPASTNAAPYNTTAGYFDSLSLLMNWLRDSSLRGASTSRSRPSTSSTRLPLNDWAQLDRLRQAVATKVNYIREVVKLADADVDFSAYDSAFIVPTRNSRRVALSPAFVDGTRSLCARRRRRRSRMV